MAKTRLTVIGLLIIFWQQMVAGLADVDPVEQLQGLTAEQVVTRIERCVAEQQIVTQFSMKIVDKSIYYDLSIAPNRGQLSWMIRLNLTQSAFEETGRQYEAAGFAITVSDSVRLGRERYYGGVWGRSPEAPTPLVLPDSPVPVSGEPVEQLSAVDALMIRFLKEHNVAGATVAIGYEGQLLYSRGFGWADVEQQAPMLPNAVMRIGSISKPLTAVAVMQLVEEGRLELDDKVMPLLKSAGYQRPLDERWNQITVRQLLQHRGGWDRDESHDPMFLTGAARTALQLKRSPRPRDMVKWQLQQPLDFDPGSREAYCNFGYCVLGRLIEEISEQSYAKYLAEQVLEPADMNHTQLAMTRIQDRRADEVRYHMQNQKHVLAVWSLFPDQRGRFHPQVVAEPYGKWDIEVMNANAGLLSTSPDLIRFSSALLDNDSQMLSPETRTVMLKSPRQSNDARGYWYGCGWNARRAGAGNMDVWHYGALEGSASLLMRRWDGYTWAVLFNTGRSTNGDRLAALIDPLMYRAIH